MESRKDQLQKQIIEALKANDNDLYSLLKSQWAHRYGVESLEELKSLELSQANQNSTYEENQIIDQSQEENFEADKAIPMKQDDNQEKNITIDENKVIESVKVENKESFEPKSYEIVDRENNEDKIINTVIDYKRTPEVKALIPIPPKPKYSYLKKWLLRK